jgi:hypothetical protein
MDRTNGKAFVIFTNAFNEQTQQGVRLLMRKLKENYKWVGSIKPIFAIPSSTFINLS